MRPTKERKEEDKTDTRRRNNILTLSHININIVGVFRRLYFVFYIPQVQRHIGKKLTIDVFRKRQLLKQNL